uniref:glycosyltransferase family 4 protein n=1 Tax=uncultured Sphingomonas sp. TaxID=158754 RepID=UPI0035CB6EF5
MKVVILSSLSWSLLNFRGPLIAKMVANGHEVIACAPDFEPDVVAALRQMGAHFRRTPMARAGTNPLRDLSTLLMYMRLLLRERPDLVVAYTQKPIIYGGIAARWTTRARLFPIMSGLGYVFSVASHHRHLLRLVVSRLYRLAIAKAECVFVFNGDDRREMLESNILDARQRVLQVPGSGVDTNHFREQPLPEGPATFLMIGRLMRDKGVGEYVAAAQIVRQTVPDARFLLLTRPETENPTGYTAAELEAWRAAGTIEFIPETRDVRPHLARAHVFVLPSYYREGLPRTILEALATGRPVITTDMPGCREPIRPGVNGSLVPPQDAPALARAMLAMVADRAALAAMSRAARHTAVSGYDVAHVNALLLDVMALGPVPSPTPARPRAIDGLTRETA